MIPTWWRDIKYFKPEEFDSPDMPGSGATFMNEEFVRLLCDLRYNTGRPMTITSGYRTASHNKSVGGKNNSAHRRGLAADIKASTTSERFEVVGYAMEMGIRRIGIAKTFVHIDIDLSLPQNVIWLY